MTEQILLVTYNQRKSTVISLRDRLSEPGEHDRINLIILFMNYEQNIPTLLVELLLYFYRHYITIS